MNDIVELGIPNFIRYLFWIAVIYYGSKYLFKWWLKRKINSHAQKMNSTVGQSEADHMRKEAGHVSIKTKQPKKSSGGAASSGDYVDFEEVE